MLRRLTGLRPSHATVVAYLALFLALGLGSAWAAGELQKDDVTSKIIKNGGVKGKDLANGAVDSSKVTDASLLGEDFADGELPQGPPGADGADGQTGPPGSPGQDATHLFASIRDNGDAVAATVGYGKGVTGVTESGSAGEYRVTFNQSVTNCVAHATSGEGDPHGTADSVHEFGTIYMQTGPPEQIEVVFEDALANEVDTSFLISAVC